LVRWCRNKTALVPELVDAVGDGELPAFPPDIDEQDLAFVRQDHHTAIDE